MLIFPIIYNHPIEITTPAYLDPAMMVVGNQIGSAFVAGTYPDYGGNPVNEASVVYYVDDAPVASTYVLQTGDVVGAIYVQLTAGSQTRYYWAEPSDVIDFSFSTGDLEWTVPAGGGAVPDAFVLANWSIADAGTNNDANVTITTLPADNGSAITDLEYRIGTGGAVSWGASTTGTYAIGGLPDGTPTNIQIRAVNANGVAAWSDIKSVTTTGAPSAFSAGDWSVTDAGTNGDATITITTLPAANGSAITDLEYRLNSGTAVSLGGATTGSYGISGLTDGSATSVHVRAVNATGAGAWSDTKSVTTTGIPAAFTAGMWTIADLATGGDARIAITSLPSDAGAAITDLQYQKDGGSWTSLGGTTTGNYDLLDVFTDGVSANILIRAVNAVGNGADSDTKSVTTTTASGISGWDTPITVINSAATATTRSGTLVGVTAGQFVVIVITACNDSSATTTTTWTVTLGGTAASHVTGPGPSTAHSFAVLFTVVAPSTGDLTLDINTGVPTRSLNAHCFKITGEGATPVVTSGNTTWFNADATTKTLPSAVTTAGNGNAIIAAIALKGGDTTNRAVTGADGSLWGQPGVNPNNDHTFGLAFKRTPTAASVSFVWSWAESRRGAAVYLQLDEA